MIDHCSSCDGSGVVDCEDCKGSGVGEVDFEAMKITNEMENSDELKALQKDAKRIRRDTESLCGLNPARKESYQEQMYGALQVVNALAERIFNPNKKGYERRRT